MSKTVIVDLDNVTVDGSISETHAIYLPGYIGCNLYEMPMHVRIGDKVYTMADEYYDWNYSRWNYLHKGFFGVEKLLINSHV